MHHAIAFGILLVLLLPFKAAPAVQIASAGGWGYALGYFLGPILFFYGITAIVYYATRWLRGADKVARFSTTKLHYVGLAFVVLSLLGQRGQQTP